MQTLPITLRELLLSKALRGLSLLSSMRASCVPGAWKEPPSDSCAWKARRALGPRLQADPRRGPRGCQPPPPVLSGGQHSVRGPDCHQTNVEAPWFRSCMTHRSQLRQQPVPTRSRTSCKNHHLQGGPKNGPPGGQTARILPQTQWPGRSHHFLPEATLITSPSSTLEHCPDLGPTSTKLKRKPKLKLSCRPADR